MLYAGEAPHAFEEEGIDVFEVPDIFHFLLVAVENTCFFNAVMALGAVFAPVDYTALADSGETWRYGSGFYMVFLRHSSSIIDLLEIGHIGCGRSLSGYGSLDTCS